MFYKEVCARASVVAVSGLFFVAPALAKGAPAPRDCRPDVTQSELAALVRQYVPYSVNSSLPSAGIYWSDVSGRLIEPLYELNANRAQPVASVQKTLTAYVAYLYGYKNGHLKMSAKFPFKESYMRWDLQGGRALDDRGRTVTASMAQRGVKISFSRLLYNLLYFSSNGSAAALADAVAGSQTAFVKLMNQTASQVLQKSKKFDSYFQNPHGLTDTDADYRYAENPNKRQQATVENMAMMLAKMMSDKGFRAMVDAVGLQGALVGNLDKKGITRAAGTTVVRSIALRCTDQRVISVLFGRPTDSSEASTQAQDFNALHAKLSSMLN